jgi:hypothetical protein
MIEIIDELITKLSLILLWLKFTAHLILAICLDLSDEYHQAEAEPWI